MKYNRTKHLELLKRFQDFKTKEKSFDREKEEKYLELTHYRAAVEDHIFWKNRDQLALLMKSFLNGTMDGEDFSNGVSELHRKLLYSFHEFESELGLKKFKDFQPDERSIGFYDFIKFLRAECDQFEDNYEDEVFYYSIRNYFLKLQMGLD